MTYPIAYTEGCHKWLYQLSASDRRRLRSGTVRVLFAFDPVRRAVLLIGGDKAGQWEAWYRTNIPIADELYDEWLIELKKQPGPKDGRRSQG